MMVEKLSSYTPQDLADLDTLMHELSTTSFCNEELLKNALNDANVHVYVIRDEGQFRFRVHGYKRTRMTRITYGS